LEGGINLFVYVQNNPINEIDPQGNKSKGKILKKVKIINKVTGRVQTILAVQKCIDMINKYNKAEDECRKSILPDPSSPYYYKPKCEEDMIKALQASGGRAIFNGAIEQCMKSKNAPTPNDVAFTCADAVSPGITDLIDWVIPE